jgi:hypothetical protein
MSDPSPFGDCETPCLVIESLRVGRDRVTAAVRVRDAAFADTNPQVARRAIAQRPNLPIHSCVNGTGPAFGDVIGHTPLPHLLEHVVVDLQAAASADPDRVFTGATRWTDRASGRAEVQVSYADDLVALRAFRDAVRLVCSWCR